MKIIIQRLTKKSWIKLNIFTIDLVLQEALDNEMIMKEEFHEMKPGSKGPGTAVSSGIELKPPVIVLVLLGFNIFYILAQYLSY